MASRLKDNGLLVVYFAHSSPEAWKTLVYAGRSAGLRVSSAFPVRTESEESVVSRGKAAITSSIVVVWRKGVFGEIDLVEKENELLNKIAEFISKARNSDLSGSTLYVMTYAHALSLLTKYATIRLGEKKLDYEDIVYQASRLTAQAFAREAHARLTSREAIAYLVFKIASHYSGRGRRRQLPSSDLILLSYGLIKTSDKGRGEEKALDALASSKIIAVSREVRGASVAKRKVYDLLEPINDNERDLIDILYVKGVNPSKPETIKTSVDMLHVLEYYSFKPKEFFMKQYSLLHSLYPERVEEAIELAKALVVALPYDHESIVANRVLNYLGIKVSENKTGIDLKSPSSLDKWFSR